MVLAKIGLIMGAIVGLIVAIKLFFYILISDFSTIAATKFIEQMSKTTHQRVKRHKV